MTWKIIDIATGKCLGTTERRHFSDHPWARYQHVSDELENSVLRKTLNELRDQLVVADKVIADQQRTIRHREETISTQGRAATRLADRLEDADRSLVYRANRISALGLRLAACEQENATLKSFCLIVDRALDAAEGIKSTLEVWASNPDFLEEVNFARAMSALKKEKIRCTE